MLRGPHHVRNWKLMKRHIIPRIYYKMLEPGRMTVIHVPTRKGQEGGQAGTTDLCHPGAPVG